MEKHVDPSFFLKYTVDGECYLEKLFWYDKVSHIDYKTFGEVLVFDTTYKCNAYNKPLVMLVYVNHIERQCLLEVHWWLMRKNLHLFGF